MSVLLIRQKTEKYEITYERKFWIHEPTKFSWEKFWTDEITTRKNLGSTKYPRKKVGLTKYPPEKIWDPLQKISDTRNTHKKIFSTNEMPTKAQWHDSTRPTRPTMAHDPRNLAHSLKLPALLNIKNIRLDIL